MPKSQRIELYDVGKTAYDVNWYNSGLQSWLPCPSVTREMQDGRRVKTAAAVWLPFHVQ